jgi:hypothetical protein
MLMPESMIERIARALCRFDNLPENTSQNGKPLWLDFAGEARAALAVMRDPTSDMLDGGEERAKGTYPTARIQAAAIHQAMIDAALAEVQ